MLARARYTACLIIAFCFCACRSRAGGEQQGAPSAQTPLIPAAPAAKPFRVVAKVHASGWAALADAGATHDPAAEQRIRDHLQGAPFATALQRCYSTPSPSLPTDITLFLTFDRSGKVARSVLEGVPAIAATCVNQLFGGLEVPGLAGVASGEGGTVSGVMDVQAL